MAFAPILPVPQNSTVAISVTGSSSNTYIDTTAQNVNLITFLFDNVGGNVAFVNWNTNGSAVASTTSSIPVQANSSRVIQVKSGSSPFDSNIGVAAISSGTTTIYVTPIA